MDHTKAVKIALELVSREKKKLLSGANMLKNHGWETSYAKYARKKYAVFDEVENILLISIGVIKNV